MLLHDVGLPMHHLQPAVNAAPSLKGMIMSLYKQTSARLAARQLTVAYAIPALAHILRFGAVFEFWPSDQH